MPFCYELFGIPGLPTESTHRPFSVTEPSRQHSLFLLGVSRRYSPSLREEKAKDELEIPNSRGDEREVHLQARHGLSAAPSSARSEPACHPHWPGRALRRPGPGEPAECVGSCDLIWGAHACMVLLEMKKQEVEVPRSLGRESELRNPPSSPLMASPPLPQSRPSKEMRLKKI